MGKTINKAKLRHDLAKAAQLRAVASMLSFVVALVVFASIAGALTGRKDEKTDLRVIFWGDVLPTSGKDLIIIGIDSSDTLHFRYFDDKGKLATDQNEWAFLGKQDKLLADLKKQIPPLLPPHKLTEEEKRWLIAETAPIVIHNPFFFLVLILSVGVSYRVCWWMTVAYCQKAVLCPRCGGSLWSCGSGNFKARRIRVIATCCPHCRVKIV